MPKSGGVSDCSFRSLTGPSAHEVMMRPSGRTLGSRYRPTGEGSLPVGTLGVSTV